VRSIPPARAYASSISYPPAHGNHVGNLLSLVMEPLNVSDSSGRITLGDVHRNGDIRRLRTRLGASAPATCGNRTVPITVSSPAAAQHQLAPVWRLHRYALRSVSLTAGGSLNTLSSDIIAGTLPSPPVPATSVSESDRKQ